MKRTYLVLFFSLWIFWILLTSSLSLANLLVGLACSLLTTFLSKFLLASHLENIQLSPRQLWRILLYLPKLIKQVVVANIDVAERLLYPEIPISPAIVKFKFTSKKPLTQFTLANSITLTPGTLTVDIREKYFFVHCLASEHVENILKGTLQNQVISIYEESE